MTATKQPRPRQNQSEIDQRWRVDFPLFEINWHLSIESKFKVIIGELAFRGCARFPKLLQC